MGIVNHIGKTKMVRQYTASQKVQNTIASADKSEIGTLDIPQGETWSIYSVWFQGGSGFGHMEFTTLPAMKSNYVQNVGADELYVHTGDKGWPVAVSQSGPSQVSLSVTNDAATSVDCAAMIAYTVTYAN